MRKLFDEELSIQDLKQLAKKIRKSTTKNHIIVLSTVFAILAIILITLVVIKVMKGCCPCHDEEEDLCDENGCCITDEDCFEK